MAKAILVITMHWKRALGKGSLWNVNCLSLNCNIISVLISCCCCNKFPQVCRNSFENRLSHWQENQDVSRTDSFCRLWWTITALSFPDSRGCVHSLACCPFHFQRQQRIIFSFLWPLLPLLICFSDLDFPSSLSLETCLFCPPAPGNPG